MAGGAAKYRHLSRSSSHRQALLRNLVTSLIKHESITTTWPKAKEAQRLAEKLITLGKRNTEHARRRAQSIFYVCFLYISLYFFFLSSLVEFRCIFLKMCCQLSLSKTNFSRHQTPHELLPKLFGPLRERYAERQGGYTRVLRVEPKKDDQAPSAILELVDGPKDMRFAITAKAIARQREQGIQTLNELTALNVRKVTRYRKDGVEALEKEIEKMTLEADKKRNKKNQEKEEGGEDKDEGRRGK